MSEVSQIAALEKQVEDQKILLDRRDTAIRLAKNADFRKLILEGFCLYDAARYVQESGDPALKAEERADALAIAQASGHLKRFLSITFQMGAHADRTMAELEEALADARAEEGQV